MIRFYILCLMILVGVTVLQFGFSNDSTKNISNKYFRHSFLFLFSYLIVHYQYYIDFLLGYVDNRRFDIWVNEKIVISAMILSTMGLFSFLIGYFSFNKKPINKYKLQMRLNIRPLEYLGIILLTLYFYFIDVKYLFGNYGRIFMGTEASYIIQVFEVVLLAIIIQNTMNFSSSRNLQIKFLEFLKKQGVIFNILLLIYFISTIISGDRGPIIFYSIAIYSSYIYVTSKIVKPVIIIILLIIGTSTISILGIVRTVKSESSFISKLGFVLSSESQIVNRFGTNSFAPQTQNLAGSIKCLNYAVDYIPEKHRFMYGRFQLQQLTSVIPFFSFINRLFINENHWRYLNSSNFITWISQGENPYSGEGSTIVADFYLDFGFIGVIIGMFLAGYVMRYAELVMFHRYIPSLFQLTVSIVLISRTIYIPRSSLLILLKLVVWTYVVLLFNKYFNSKKILKH
jgi:hypothetical protein